MDLEERFWAKVVIKDGCWAWSGAKVNGGYGVLTIGGRGAGHIRAHRLSFIMHKGEIPAGALVLHKCDNPECTNPDHLELGSHADNSRHISERGRHPGSQQTHCKRGHPFTPDNTIFKGNGRWCRTCKNELSRKRLREKRGEMFGVPAWVEKTHCPKGHPFDDSNTYTNPNGYKECKACRRERIQRFKAKRHNI